LSEKIAKYFINILKLNNKSNKEPHELVLSAKSYPICIFPEIKSTNGRYGLLKFDPHSFESMKLSCIEEITPVCVEVKRCYLPFNNNVYKSSSIRKFCVQLFTPMTEYHLKVLSNEKLRIDDENVEQFAERCRHSIHAGLKGKLKLASFNSEKLRQILAANEERRREVERQNREHIRQQERERQRHSMQHGSFSASSHRSAGSNNNKQSSLHEQEAKNNFIKIALQIKDILPYVSFDTIQKHIHSVTTIDIDTIIASILDSEMNNDNDSSHQQPSTSSSNVVTQTSNKKNSSSNKKYLSLEEQKFNLISQARERFRKKEMQNDKMNHSQI
jgi:hypothetical protein